jgi:hypothetical protein
MERPFFAEDARLGMALLNCLSVLSECNKATFPQDLNDILKCRNFLSSLSRAFRCYLFDRAANLSSANKAHLSLPFTTARRMTCEHGCRWRYLLTRASCVSCEDVLT